MAVAVTKKRARKSAAWVDPAALVSLEEASAVRIGIAETVGLERQRGEVFVGTAPRRRLDPIALLLCEGEITRAQARAADKYGTLYRSLHEKRKSRVGWEMLFEHQTRSVLALARVRQEGLSGDAELSWLCDQVCGRDQRVERLYRLRERPRGLARLKSALDQLSRFYGMVRWEARDE